MSDEQRRAASRPTGPTEPTGPTGPTGFTGERPDRRRTAGRRVLRWLCRLAVILALWPLVLTVVYRFVAPPVSNVMLLRAAAGHGITTQWVDLDDISPHLVRAVVAAEDRRFCLHGGVDWQELEAVVQQAIDRGEGPARGASTISMQTAKNLLLWDGRHAIRKALEVPLAEWMDLVWGKRRVIEVYLNIVEWAPGVYGAEAAARHHFGKPAQDLTRREAALLAAVLPNPIERDAGRPSERVRAVAKRILARMRGRGLDPACLDLRAHR